MKILYTSLLLFFSIQLNAQLLSWSPAFIQENTATIEITCDATLGNKGLQGHTPLTDVYVHVGCITSSSVSNNDWKSVPFTWGTTAANANAVNVGANKWKFTINGGLRTFFNITNPNDKILKIAILFRSGNGNKALRNSDGSDMYVPVYDNGLYTRIDNPLRTPVFNLGVEPNNLSVGSMLNINANANQNAQINIYYDNNLLSTTNNTTAAATSTLVNTAGIHTIISNAKNTTTLEEANDTVKIFIAPPVNIAPLPSGITKDGIYYDAADPSVCTLVIYALGKKNVSVVGDFNNWTESLSYQMNKTSDGKYFWIKLTGLTSGEEYAFQYIIDGSLRVSDYNVEKVLDPWNDQYISSATYPNLKAYPTGKASGIVGILQTNKPTYNWQYTSTFTRPNKRNLMIYELLLRDFVAEHNYQTLKDSLPYLSKLGVNVIQLMPVNEFEGNNSWGYNPNYFMALDKYYGTENAFKAFIDECHRNGIAVVMDIALNHAFGSCPMVQMYWDAVNNRPDANNPWFNQADKHPYGVGYDFNHEAQVTKDLVDRVVTHWLTNYKIDGFRWDLSKGFTQNQTNDVGSWGNYDAGRIATWKRIYDKMQSVSNSSYCILEHFATNSEEQELSNYGMLLWGNANGSFREAVKGNNANSDFGWGITSSARSWTNPHLIGYAESHDEERLMYDCSVNGVTNGPYNVKDTNTALKRCEMAAAFLLMTPGPKMIWQMGELGYNYSINRCTNGTVNGDCRLAEKPIRWDYQNNPNRKKLLDVYSRLFAFRKHPSYAPIFTTNPIVSQSLGGNFKSMISGSSSVTSPRVVVIGNFGTSTNTSTVSFPSGGTWYNLFDGATINVVGVSRSFTLQPGEYYVFTSTNVFQILPIKNNGSSTTVTHQFDKMNVTIAPNPINSSANLKYQIPSSGKVSIKLIDINGRIVKELFESFQSKGVYTLNINKQNLLIKGLHFIQFDFNGNKQIDKVIFE